MESVDFVPSSFGTICIFSVSRLTIEWKDTDYDVVGDGVPVGRISTMSGAIFSLALQLPFPQISESMGNHDSKIVDAASVD
jgi:hypothetical protein